MSSPRQKPYTYIYIKWSQYRHIYHQRLTSTCLKWIKNISTLIGGTKQKTDKSKCSINRYFPWVLVETTKTNYRRQNLVFNHQQRRQLWEKAEERLGIKKSSVSLTLLLSGYKKTKNKTKQINVTKQTQTLTKMSHFGAFSAFVCIFRSGLFFIVNVQQLWEIEASCQHFNMIKECVNQSAAQVPQKWNPHACYFRPQSGPQPRDSFPLSRRIPWSRTNRLVWPLLC